MRAPTTNLWAWISVMSVSVSSCLAVYRDNYPLPSGTTLGQGSGINLNDPSLTTSQFDALTAAGYKWARLDIDWSVVQPQPGGVYHFEKYDPIIQGLVARKIRPIAILHCSRLLVGNGGAVDLPEEVTAFQNFAAATAKRYERKGILWEIWNEPNVATYWHGNPNVAQYMNLVHGATQAIRKLTPNEYIVGPALGGFDPNWMQACIASGLLADVDAVTVHPYNLAGPEANGVSYQDLKVMIALNAPAGKSIPVFCGEDGVNFRVSGVTDEMQAQYAQRTLLYNEVAGIPLSVWFNFRDFADPELSQTSQYGLYTTDMVARPAVAAVRWMSANLAGWTYRARLATDSPADYVLLYSAAKQQKLVAWTTNSPHPISLSGFTSSFSASTYRSNWTVKPSPALTLSLSGNPTIFVPDVADPILTALNLWGSFSATQTWSNRLDAANSLLPMIVSKAWSKLPAGTKLVVEDVPTAMPGWGRPTGKWEFTNLTQMTASNPAVSQMLDEMPRIQDRLPGAHTVRATIVLANGAKFTKSASVFHRDPVRLSVTTPFNGQLSIQLENPSGRALAGSIQIEDDRGGLLQAKPVVTSTGQTFLTLTLSLITSSRMESGFRVRLYDTSSNLTRPNLPIASSDLLSTKQYLAASANLMSVAMGGDASVFGTYSCSPTLGAGEGAPAEQSVFQIDYRTGTGQRFFNIQSWNDPALGAQLPVNDLTVGMWVNGDNSNVELSTVLWDETSQRFKLMGPRVNWSGWRWVSFTYGSSRTFTWGGANDGVPHGKFRMYTPLVIDTCGNASNGSLQVTEAMAVASLGK